MNIYHEDQHRAQKEDRDAGDDDRIGHRRLHLLAQLVVGLEGFGHPDQHGVQLTAGLSGLHHRDEEAAEDLGVLGHRGR
jgi:hypothetical protein